MSAAAAARSPLATAGWIVLALLFAALVAGVATFHRAGWPQMVGDEATFAMQAESLAWDGDLLYTRGDYDRFVDHWGHAPEGLILQSRDDGRHLVYGKPFLYAAVVAPFVRLAPRHGAAMANVLLLALASVLAASTLRRRLGPVAPLWVAVFVFASVVFAYVFWIHADVFLLAAVAAGYALAWRGERPPRQAPPDVWEPEEGGGRDGGRCSVSSPPACCWAWRWPSGRSTCRSPCRRLWPPPAGAAAWPRWPSSPASSPCSPSPPACSGRPEDRGPPTVASARAFTAIRASRRWTSRRAVGGSRSSSGATPRGSTPGPWASTSTPGSGVGTRSTSWWAATSACCRTCCPCSSPRRPSRRGEGAGPSLSPRRPSWPPSFSPCRSTSTAAEGRSPTAISSPSTPPCGSSPAGGRPPAPVSPGRCSPSSSPPRGCCPCGGPPAGFRWARTAATATSRRGHFAFCPTRPPRATSPAVATWPRGGCG